MVATKGGSPYHFYISTRVLLPEQPWESREEPASRVSTFTLPAEQSSGSTPGTGDSQAPVDI